MISEMIPTRQMPFLVERPLFSCKVCAGFPSPAQDHIERSLDLNELLATDKPSVSPRVRIVAASIDQPRGRR